MEKAPIAPENARIILQRELAKRCESNPRYSLRAFAKSLGISHPLLSLILSGKRRLSKKAARKIADKLWLQPEEKQFFLGELDFAEGPTEHFHQIDLDTFAVISDWVHYAVLSLLDIRGAKFEANWIGRRLNVTPEQAQETMDRLVRLGLVKKQGQSWKQTGLPLKVENSVSTIATRKFHRGLLEKAVESLERDPMELRTFSSMTMAIDPELLPYAIEKIRKFRRNLTAELEKMKPAKEVYNFTIQLYPVSNKGDRNE